MVEETSNHDLRQLAKRSLIPVLCTTTGDEGGELLQISICEAYDRDSVTLGTYTKDKSSVSNYYICPTVDDLEGFRTNRYYHRNRSAVLRTYTPVKTHHHAIALVAENLVDGAIALVGIGEKHFEEWEELEPEEALSLAQHLKRLNYISNNNFNAQLQKRQLQINAKLEQERDRYRIDNLKLGAILILREHQYGLRKPPSNKRFAKFVDLYPTLLKSGQDCLSSRELVVLVFYYLEGWSPESIADKMNLSPKRLSTYRARARRELKKAAQNNG